MGGYEGKNKFVYQKWTSPFWLSTQNSIFPQRKIFLVWLGGGWFGLGAGGVRQIPAPPPTLPPLWISTCLTQGRTEKSCCALCPFGLAECRPCVVSPRISGQAHLQPVAEGGTQDLPRVLRTGGGGLCGQQHPVLQGVHEVHAGHALRGPASDHQYLSIPLQCRASHGIPRPPPPPPPPTSNLTVMEMADCEALPARAWEGRHMARPRLGGDRDLYRGGGVGGVGGSEAKKQVCVPKIHLQFPAPLIKFFFSLSMYNFRMWSGRKWAGWYSGCMHWGFPEAIAYTKPPEKQTVLVNEGGAVVPLPTTAYHYEGGMAAWAPPPDPYSALHAPPPPTFLSSAGPVLLDACVCPVPLGLAGVCCVPSGRRPGAPSSPGPQSVGGWWRLAVGDPSGLSSRGVLNKNRNPTSQTDVSSVWGRETPKSGPCLTEPSGRSFWNRFTRGRMTDSSCFSGCFSFFVLPSFNSGTARARTGNCWEAPASHCHALGGGAGFDRCFVFVFQGVCGRGGYSLSVGSRPSRPHRGPGSHARAAL